MSPSGTSFNFANLNFTTYNSSDSGYSFGEPYPWDVGLDQSPFSILDGLSWSGEELSLYQSLEKEALQALYPYNMTHYDFYGEPGAMQNIAKIRQDIVMSSKWHKINPFYKIILADSEFYENIKWRDKYFFYDGQYALGSDLNYYVQGMIDRRFGKKKSAGHRTIWFWKSMNIYGECLLEVLTLSKYDSKYAPPGSATFYFYDKGYDEFCGFNTIRNRKIQEDSVPPR